VFKKIFLLIVALSSFCFAIESKQPTFKIRTINDKIITIQGSKNGLILPEFKGKVILLEFWGVHCPPCLYSIPKYIELTKKYRDKVEMLAIEVEDTSKEELKDFVKKKGINYNIIALNDARYFVSYIGQRARWRGSIPFLIIFDKNGNVVEMQKGFSRGEFRKIEGIINYLYTKKVSSVNVDTNKTKKSNIDKTSSITSKKIAKEANTTK